VKKLYFLILVLGAFLIGCKSKDSVTEAVNETPICKNCGTKVKLDDNTDTLPPCPKCDKTTFIKVG
jgi:predicted RNA-binding Zn-ribbon protein involved in translation (DUF1610 family)